MTIKAFPKFQYMKVVEDGEDSFVTTHDFIEDAIDEHNQPQEVATYKLVSTKTYIKKSVIEEVTED